MSAARDVLAYLSWWDDMLWRDEQRADPAVQWQADLSWNEIAYAAGIEAPRLAPGDLALDTELSVELYWPGAPPSR